MARLRLKRFGDNIPDEGGPLDIHKEMSVGRDSTNDIVVQSEEVSRHQCLISLDQDDNIFVVDLNSKNGTYVNGKKVTRIQVHPNDVLQIGLEKFVFILEQEQKFEKDESDHNENIFEETVIAGLEVEEETSNPVALRSILSVDACKEKVESVVIKSVEQIPKEYHCPVNSIYTIGRLPFSDIFIDDTSVSRTHAKIDVRENRAVITDAGSTNGSYVNNKKITHMELQDEDTIKIGERQFVVSFVVNSDNSFSSFMKSANFNTIDLLQERNLILEIFKDEYGERVLLEVERQTLLYCQEFELYNKHGNKIGTNINTIAKMIHLLSNAFKIVDGSSSATLICKKSNIVELNSHYLLQAQEMIKNGNGKKIIYFEEKGPDMREEILMNGLAMDLNTGKKIIVFGIPYDNLLYLVYASNRLVSL